MKSGFKRFHIGACRFQVILRVQTPNSSPMDSVPGTESLRVRVVVWNPREHREPRNSWTQAAPQDARGNSAGQPGPQPGNSASNRTSKHSCRLHLRLMPSTWGRGELSPFLRSLRWRSLHRWVSGCRFLTLRGLRTLKDSSRSEICSLPQCRVRDHCRDEAS